MQQSSTKLILLFLVSLTFRQSCSSTRPIIGILSQELSEYLAHIYDPSVYKSYIAASYVKYFESSGARVAPIPIGRSLDYYRELTNRVNGVVFPGGGLPIDERTEYKMAGNLLLTALKEAADQGNPVPALGVCLGMELMVMYDYKNTTSDPADSPLVACKGESLNQPLTLRQGTLDSPLFSRVRAPDINELEKRAITANEHKWCVTPSSLERSGLNNTWLVLSTSLTKDGEVFVSAMESMRAPFYALMFHPEKNAFEWKPTKTYVHDADAVAALRTFGDSFVDICKQNDNSFPLTIERRALIDRHVTVDSGANGTAYEQIYLFRADSID